MPDLKGTVIPLHCFIHVNVIQLQRNYEIKIIQATDHEMNDNNSQVTVKELNQNADLHHILKSICLCISVAVSLGLADYTIVFKEKDMTVVTSRGCSNSRSSFPYLERSLGQEE